MLDVEAEAVVNAHVLIGHPYQGEKGNEISTPSRIEHVKPRDDQKQTRDVVAETVLAGEQIKEFSLGEATGLARLTLAVFSWLAEDLFVGDGPGYAGHRNCQHKKPHQLHSERDGETWHGYWIGCSASLAETPQVRLYRMSLTKLHDHEYRYAQAGRLLRGRIVRQIGRQTSPTARSDGRLARYAVKWYSEDLRISRLNRGLAIDRQGSTLGPLIFKDEELPPHDLSRREAAAGLPQDV